MDSIFHKTAIFWAAEIFIIIFLTLIISHFADHILLHIKKKSADKKTLWKELFFKSVRKPLKFLIWILGITLATSVSGDKAHIDLSALIHYFKNLGIIFCLSWFVWKLLSDYEESVIHRGNKDEMDITTCTAIMKLLKLTLVITVTLMSLQTFGISINAILAFGGIGGVAIGFAAQNLLSNFFGAIMIFLDRPFSVGDHIKSPDRQIEGTVDFISWRLTQIRTLEGRTLYIPNSVFSTIIIENFSRGK